MKKKLVTGALLAAFGAVAVTGGTLAYFSDTDAQTNTFTTGNVAIDLWEDFGDNSGIEKLVPATGSAQDGTLKNGIEKEVYVVNDGSENAYVRVHIAIPALLDNGDPSFDAGSNVLHFNYDSETVGDGKWDWSKEVDDDLYTGNWNHYETSISGLNYNVYVVTYDKELVKDEQTLDAMSQVYLDSKVTNDDITNLKLQLGNEWKIYVVAEGGQAEGFANAYEALNAQFGTPGSEGYEAPDFLAAAENRIFMNND